MICGRILFQSTRPVRGATHRRSGIFIGHLFQSTRPVRGATQLRELCGDLLLISIHAPRAGRDQTTWRISSRPWNFNPRAPCGARLVYGLLANGFTEFQSTRPVRGATWSSLSSTLFMTHFNPRAPCGARPICICPPLVSPHFNPRAPCGRDSKSIQNYFTHFCDKRQFLDNFTQNAAF